MERCIRNQLKGADQVGTVLQQHAKDPEVQEIYARCVTKVQKIHNANNWRNISSCVNSKRRGGITLLMSGATW